MLGRSPSARLARSDTEARSEGKSQKENRQFGVNVAEAMLGDDAEGKKGPFTMQDQTVNGTLVANERVRPDTSILH
jgi:hypothetical protein